MKKIIIASATAAALALSFSALAGSPDTAQDQQMASPNYFYVGGFLGYNILDKGSLPSYVPASIRHDWNDTKVYNRFGGGINAGYDFKVADNFYLAPEIDAAYLGSFKSAHGYSGASMYGISAVAKATYDVTKNIDVFVKGGIVREIASNDDDYGTSDIAGTASVGAGYKINPNWEVFTEYTHIFGKSLAKMGDDSNSAFEYNNVNVGVSYNFL